MFESVAAKDLLGVIALHDFDAPKDYEDYGADRIDAITALDRVICGAQVAQVEQIAAFDHERAQMMNAVATTDHSLSVIGEIGMARNISPSIAGRQYGFAVGLARMPQSTEVFRSGRISERTARAVVRETIGLTVEQITALDECLAPRLPGLTTFKASAAARHLTIEIDAKAAYERTKANRSDRFVSVFPEGDGVAILQVRGPAEQIVAAFDALNAHARAECAAGDGRTLGQLMSDTLVERVTGLAHATDVSVEIGLVMSTEGLLRTEQVPAMLAGFGPVPPELAHDLCAAGEQTWLRRLFTDPVDGSLVARDPRRRRFDGPLAKLITSRDRTCRQPGCDCRIRDLDHVLAHHRGGQTRADNGQGLCRRSHTLKHLPGWSVTTNANNPGDMIWRTPTGHRYSSTEPPMFGYQARKHGKLRQ